MGGGGGGGGEHVGPVDLLLSLQRSLTFKGIFFDVVKNKTKKRRKQRKQTN